MKRIALLVLPALLAACVSPPPAVWRDSDLDWSTFTVPGTPEQVFRASLERTRRCGYLIQHGEISIVPQGNYFPNAQEQVIDLTLRGDAMPSMAQAYGRVRLLPSPQGTIAKVGMPSQDYMDGAAAAKISAALEHPDAACAS